MEHISRNDAFELLKKYNIDPFHIQHALTVEAVMKWYANELGYGEDAEYWGIVGLLHDIDFELYPEQHCIKAPELLREGGVSEDIIHGVVSHGYGITVDVAPEHEMEKVLFAADELTGLIWAAALMRPSKSTKDMELKSLKKKYKVKRVIDTYQKEEKNKLITIKMLKSDVIYPSTNENSLVMLVTTGGYTYLFTGDIPSNVEEDLYKKYGEIDVDVLKVAHHGSRTASSKDFIQAVSPSYAVISYAQGNSYGLPNNEVFEYLKPLGTKIYETAKDGTVVLQLKNGQVSVAS